MSFLKLRGVNKYFEQAPQTRVQVLNNLNIEVEKGEFLAILGPSGCGKSTCLKIIAGLDLPCSGEIWINQQNVSNTEPQKRGLSMVFQSYALLPHLSVKENILFGLKARKIAKQEQQKRLNEAVSMVSLEPQLNKKPAQLSGGQCQRVALARAIVSQAPLCLMDEPLSNLDAKLRASMRQEIRALQKNLGLTLIYVTHDQIEAMSMADKIVLLNAGKIEQTGAPYELYNQPASTFVATFIGQPGMNLCNLGGYILGVRPEHVYLSDEGYKAKVKACDYQGCDTLITVEFNQAIWHVPLAGHKPMPLGETVLLNWCKSNLHLFNRASTLRLNPEDASFNHAVTETNHQLTQFFQTRKENHHA